MLPEEDPSSHERRPAPACFAKQTQNERRNYGVKQQAKIREIGVGNHSDWASRARSTLPFAVNGKESRKTNLRGNMYTGNRSASCRRSDCVSSKCDASVWLLSTTKAASDWEAPFLITGITTASLTEGNARRFASTSPSSMR